MRRRLAILGASGHGRVVAETARSIGWDSIVFFDDDNRRLHQLPESMRGGGFSVIASIAQEFDGVFVAVGACVTRYQKLRQLIDAGARIPALIHKAAYVSDDVILGAGSLVCAGAVIQTGSRCGSGVIVNTGATIDHDCLLGDSVHVCPGAHLAGDVRVGDRAWVGIGASVIQGLSIGVDSVVGAGAAVDCDVPDSVTVVGVPARPIRARS
jgi:sugar O-acyltransferase (sialic acid O-acetyltransferase NeuD family)